MMKTAMFSQFDSCLLQCILKLRAVQSNTLRPYLTCIRSTLEAALCIRNFPSQLVS